MSAPAVTEAPVSSSAPFAASSAASADINSPVATELAEIDASVRKPVLFFFGSALVWLLGGSLLHLLAAIKLHNPGFLADSAYLTFGRVWPAANDALLYGWMSTAGIGVALWLTARLCRVRFRYVGLLNTAGVVWNFGLLVGVIGVLNGKSTSFVWLEFPRAAAVILFLAYLFIAVWVLLMLRDRRPGHLYVSLWYVLTALFCFPWMYATANLVLQYLPVQASVQPVVNWWFVHSFYGLWLTPLALAAAYYLIPKILGRPVYNYPIAVLGFWTLILLSGWRGGQSLIGGPVPVWIPSVGIGAAILSIIPMVAIISNLFGTLRGRDDALSWSPTLRFTFVGLSCFLLSGVFGLLLATRSANRMLHFTQFEVAWATIALYGFVSMTLFGAMYYIVPRLTTWDWPSQNYIRYHFWLSVVGLGTIVIPLIIGGVVQGYGLNDPGTNIISIVGLIEPLFVARSVGEAILVLAHAAFGASFALCLFRATGGQTVNAGRQRYAEFAASPSVSATTVSDHGTPVAIEPVVS